MQRRDFIKLSVATGLALVVPQNGFAKAIDFNKINFNESIYNGNNAQTIIVFLYGGASQLSGNITNIEDIEKHSQNSYSNYFRGVTKTANGCWQEAGGVHMEKMISDGDMTLYRTCYSPTREENNNKAHGICTEQNQKGSFDVSGGGIVANIGAILNNFGAINSNTIMPFVTMEGESHFYDTGSNNIPMYLKPATIEQNFSNPYERASWSVRNWIYYNSQERKDDNHTNYDPKFSKDMDKLAQKHNSNLAIKTNFEKRSQLESFIKSIKNAQTPDLGDDNYLNDTFANKLKSAINILDKNPSTKILTLNTGGLGGWDDHNDARGYVIRMEYLFKALRSATAHLKAINKIGSINIMVFGEFGRNVNLNSAFGWDHGNLQNLYVIGGKDYFTHKGVVGETVLDVTGRLNRLWLKPKSGTYTFEPMSIASTLYRIYGIENPNELTNGNFEPLNILS